ncbi:MAG: Crp/Fnr family transcriptional regulator [Solirubrobacterales bacterium]|nr:Crp/Fnr family transcriptional regulator [Solirubrobacterales bacterium]
MSSPAHTSPRSIAREGGERPLLELAPDLVQDLDEGARRDAGATPVQTVALERGPWSPTELFAYIEQPLGLLVAEGLIVRDTLLADSTSSDLVGPGDVAAFGAAGTALVPAEIRWAASVPSRVAVLDMELLRRLETWPGVTARLLARAAQQTSELAVQRAYSQLPRVDLRLLALFWHMAERWGRVGSDGIVVRIALTHEALGRMVGARRPTVSLALKELARTGTIVRRSDGSWLLRQDGLGRLRPTDVPWEPPEATLVPSVAAAPDAPAATDREDQPALRARLEELGRDHLERERRVREVLARCAATREQLIEARERRASRLRRSSSRR